MGAVISKASKASPWTLWCPLCSGLVFSLLSCFWMPWERVHPNDSNLREALGYAPIWSHRFAATTGVHRDWPSFAISLAVIWTICFAAAFMLGMSTRQE